MQQKMPIPRTSRILMLAFAGIATVLSTQAIAPLLIRLGPADLKLRWLALFIFLTTFFIIFKVTAFGMLERYRLRYMRRIRNKTAK